MRPITRFCASLSALAALIGCTSDSRRGAGSSGDVEQTFTPTQYTVEDFYQNTSFGGASFSPDRRKILVSSNRSGIWNAYTVPVAGGPPEPVTRSTTNSIFAVDYFPHDDRILYSSDSGGNELTHIYVRNRTARRKI